MTQCEARMDAKMINVITGEIVAVSIQCMWDQGHEKDEHYGQGPDGSFGTFQLPEERDRMDCGREGCTEKIDLDFDIVVNEPCPHWDDNHETEHTPHIYHLMCYPVEKFMASWHAGRK